MTVAGEFSLAAVLPLLGMLATLAASWGIVRFQAAQHDKRIARPDERCEAIGRELAEFKVDAVQRFVSDEALAKVEARISDGFNRLADRLDRLVEAAPRRTTRS